MTVTGGKLDQYQDEVSFLYRLSDAALIVSGLLVALWLYGVPWSEPYMLAAIMAALVFIFSAEIADVYRPWRGAPLRQVAIRVFFSWAAVSLMLLVLAYMTKTTATYSRVAISGWVLVMPFVLVGWRLTVRYMFRVMRRKGYNCRRVAVVGHGRQAGDVVDEIIGNPDFGLHLEGVYYDTEDGAVDAHAAFARAGGVEDLMEDAHKGQFDLVYIAMPLAQEYQIRELIRTLSDTTVSVYLVPDLFLFDVLRGGLVNLGAIPTVSVFETPFYGVNGWVKRLEDIVLSSLILLIIALPMVMIALVVILTSRGPAIFRQDRYGLDGSKIEVWKFRTMTCQDNGDTVVQATQNDVRVTPLGKFLRKTSLDELPQFINVLQGRMSIVGPRPHAVAHNELYRKQIEGYMLRHKVKPGITGWAQVNGWRGETDTLEKMQKRVEHDLWYLRNWSLSLDVKLIFVTIWASFFRPVAY